MSEQLGYEVDVPLAFQAAGDATRNSLKAEGFGVLTEIDLQAASFARIFPLPPNGACWRQAGRTH